jgi:hypothetical protein
MEDNMKKIFLIAVLLLVLCGSVYSETLRYYDMGRGRYVTVNVTHIGWRESYQTISGAGTRNAKLLSYTAMKLNYETQWGEWELMASITSSLAQRI